MPYWVRGIASAPEGKLWVAGYNVGLLSLDPGTGVFSQKTPGIVAWNLFRDRSGKFWIGSDGDGLCVFDPGTDSTEIFRYEPNNPNSLSHDFSIGINPPSPLTLQFTVPENRTYTLTIEAVFLQKLPAVTVYAADTNLQYRIIYKKSIILSL